MGYYYSIQKKRLLLLPAAVLCITMRDALRGFTCCRTRTPPTWCWMLFSCSSAYAFSTNTAVLMSSAVVSVAPLRNWNLVHSIIAAGGNGRPGRHAAGSSSVRLAPNHTVVPTIQAPHPPPPSSSSSFRLSLNPLLSSSFQAPSSCLSYFLITDGRASLAPVLAARLLILVVSSPFVVFLISKTTLMST
jgi:hypothetical protein